MLRSVSYKTNATPSRPSISSSKVNFAERNVRNIRKANINTKAGELEYSYLSNPSTFDPIDTTFGHFFSTQVRDNPYNNALNIRFQDISWSYKEFKKHVEAVANGFQELGIQSGHTVGIISGTTAEMVATQFACAKVGATCVPFTGVKKVKDLERYMQLYRPTVLLMPFKIEKMNYLELIKEIWPHFGKMYQGVPVRSNRYPFCKRVIITERKGRPMDGQYRFDEFLCYGPFGYYEHPLRRLALNITPDHPAMVLGNNKDVHKAKPIALSHRNLLNAGKAIGHAAGMGPHSRVMIPGYQSSLLGALANYSSIVSTSTMIMPTPTWKTDEILRLTSEEECTTIFATPEDYEALLSHPDFSKYKYDALNTAVVDQSAPEELLTEIKNKMGIENIVSPSGEMEQAGIRKINDEWAPNSDIKIVRHRDNKVLPLGETGSLRIKGPHTARGYWNDMGLQTNETDETGFFITGQDAKMDKDGNVTIMGKSKEQVDVVL
eukprot:gb/GECH01011466.1/.p1 GENE.gb/GECH01011466.1/~~gb/GECH01011466.1/.p1  ORF type:complete len:492 (+),score=98.72 gb/GECH01011466.1/:1-1476(+)